MKLLDAPAARAAGLVPMPGEPGLPVLRRNVAMLRGRGTTSFDLYDAHGPVAWSQALGVRYISATGPEAAQEILVNRDKAWSNGDGWQHFIGPFFERGLMLLDFAEHHAERRIMQQAFTRDRLEGYLASMSPVVEQRVSAWAERDRLAMFPSVTELGLEVATRSFLGDVPGERTREVMDAFHACTQATLSVVRRPLPGTTWGRAVTARRVLEDYFGPQITAARGRTDDDDLLAVLCRITDEHGATFSDRAVLNHVIFLVMAAHDTSVSAMTSMASFLATHPDWQERCREESRALGRRDLTYADLDALPSLDLVMSESMRLVTPLPAMARRAVKDTSLLGHHVPAGTVVQLTVQLNHWLPSVWTDPMRFDPERFAEPRREDKAGRFAYMPFGGGVHKCIGLHFARMEIFAVLHQMLTRFRWSVPAGYEMPISWKALPYPTDGLPLTLEPLS